MHEWSNACAWEQKELTSGLAVFDWARSRAIRLSVVNGLACEKLILSQWLLCLAPSISEKDKLLGLEIGNPNEGSGTFWSWLVSRFRFGSISRNRFTSWDSAGMLVQETIWDMFVHREDTWRTSVPVESYHRPALVISILRIKLQLAPARLAPASYQCH